ncbi:ABC transporter permease [Raoultibacter phocaeensis]|uniref:ABC transporter permease n=1 Tax=Raoultibacter phocaeensis TaxID=2479841 RepID=UPI0011190528|nr:ABC transporter permease [Raoultibacter phocaeensis]
MLNYMKSEGYRIVHGRELYLLTGILCAVVLAANMILYGMTFVDDTFPYATVKFSLSNLLGMLPLLFALAGLLVALLYADDRKNGTLKNAIVHGCSRTSVFVGKCIVSIAAGFVSMAIVMVVYLASAMLLLEGPAGEPASMLLTATVAALPSIVAAVVLAVGLDGFFPKTTAAIVAFVVIVFAIPQVLALIGLRIEPVAAFAQWLPGNIFGSEVNEVFTGGQLPWDKPFGWARCLLAGFLGLVLFAAIGLRRARKTEL